MAHIGSDIAHGNGIKNLGSAEKGDVGAPPPDRGFRLPTRGSKRPALRGYFDT